MTNLVLLRPKINIPDAMPNPPIGLGYIASILRKNQHQIHLIDCAILKQSYLEIISQIKRINPDAIGITALSPYFMEMRKLARMLHRLEIPLILGGVHVSALPEFSLRECGADFAVLGEGELTILELMNKWDDPENRKKIKGISYFENGKFIMNPKREPVLNLDSLPFPAWDLINPLKYTSMPFGRLMKRYPVAPILTTRGCPYSCSYCASTRFWRGFRTRSPQNVVDEMEYLMNEFGVREIHIWDDNFTFIKKHVIEICREILRRKLDLTLSCPNGVHIGHVDKELLTIMRRAGFYMICFSIESGVQSILDRANKKLNLKEVPKMVKIAKNLGYYVPVYFIFGLPGETYITARKTIQFAKSLPIDGMIAFMAKPIPGSKLFKEWVQDRELPEFNFDWFHFLVANNILELSDGKKTIKLPRDAIREFHYRPIQILRILKIIINVSKTFQMKQILEIIRRFYQTYF